MSRKAGTDNRAELYKQGLCDKDIGAKVGVHPTAISKWRYQNDLPPNYQKVERSRPGFYKYDEAIRKYHALGYHNYKIADITGATTSTVYDAMRRMGLKGHKAIYTGAKREQTTEKASLCWSCGKGFPCRCEKIRTGEVVYQKSHPKNTEDYRAQAVIVDECNDYVSDDTYPRVTEAERNRFFKNEIRGQLLGAGLRSGNRVGHATGRKGRS